MTDLHFWYIFLGILLASFGFLRHFAEKSPVTPALIYFALGVAIGPWGLDRLEIVLKDHSWVIEYLMEFIVIVSVFAAAMKLKLRNERKSWNVILRLSLLGMALTSFFAAGVGVWLLGLSFPQVENEEDRDRLRQSLTGEAGINDSSAFPFIYLAMGLLGARELGAYGEIWIVKDLFWGITGAVGIGWLTGRLSALGVLKSRQLSFENHVLDDFMAVGVMATSYGLALWLSTYGFVAVFVAGISFRWHFELPQPRRSFCDKSENDSNLKQMIKFHDQLERFCEIFGVIAIGALIALIDFEYQYLLFGLILLFVLRPIATRISLVGSPVDAYQKKMISWLGIRGVGSMYYLFHAANHGVSREDSQTG